MLTQGNLSESPFFIYETVLSIVIVGFQIGVANVKAANVMLPGT